MEKIETLTKEQEAKIPIYLKRYFDKVYNSKPIDKKMAEDSINFIYKSVFVETGVEQFTGEHTDIALKEGETYKYVAQQEYNPYLEAIKKVID
jgi:hypothetical protein